MYADGSSLHGCIVNHALHVVYHVLGETVHERRNADIINPVNIACTIRTMGQNHAGPISTVAAFEDPIVVLWSTGTGQVAVVLVATPVAVVCEINVH